MERRLALVSTVQFVATLQAVAAELRTAGYQVTVPQVSGSERQRLPERVTAVTNGSRCPSG